ncbi:MAG: M56 family metallopeptidase [Terracidiphilus sp.]|jgi:beta-lactamase regulating signal transducer with metallopeptidase domain
MISVLIEAALRALVVALTVGTGLRLFRVSNVLAQKIAWGLVLASAVAMPQLMRLHVLPSSLTVKVPAARWTMASEDSALPETVVLSAPVAELPVTSSTAISVSRPKPRAAHLIHAPIVSDRQPELAPQVPPQEALPALAQPSATLIFARQTALPDATRLLRPEMLAALLYLAVCATLLFRMFYGLVMASRIWFAAALYEADLGSNPEQNPALGLRVRFSFAISSPVTIGSGVLLPADCLNWDREKLRIVLAHERAHVRQGDFYLQLLAGLYTAAFWFSPLGWWLKHKLSDLSEAISDRAGLKEAASRTSYAQVLLEFAAMPRPTVLGVAMARSSNLSHRIERFLDESRFRQAFAGSYRRVLLVVLLVPIALFAGTAFVRVEAATLGQSAPAMPAPTAAPNPTPAPEAAPVPAVSAVPADFTTPPASDQAAPASPSAPAAPAVEPAAPALPEPPDNNDTVIVGPGQSLTISKDGTITNTNTDSSPHGQSTSVGHGYAYRWSSDGDSYAIVTGPGEHYTFSGEWSGNFAEQIERARKLAHGKFLLFTHDDKTYIVDDPQIAAQIEAMYAPMEALGKLQEALGLQQEELGKQQEKLGHQQESVNIRLPDLSKEMAALNAATAKLQAKAGSTVSQEELAETEAKLAEVQSRLGELQSELGDRQGSFGEMQGKLGEQQGKLGEEQGRLGEKQGRLAEEADRKVRSIIDRSLRDGKAHPVN